METRQSGQPIDDARMKSIIEFLQAAENLKNTLRTGITSQGRIESTAEHSWRLCLMVLLFADELKDVDLLHVIKLCIIHDLGEAISGDIPAIHQAPEDNKATRERSDLAYLCASLPDDLRGGILALWDEYETAETQESQFAKGFDKLETMLQHLVGENAQDFDYGFNLTYGLDHTNKHPLLRQLRQLVNDATREKISHQRESNLNLERS